MTSDGGDTYLSISTFRGLQNLPIFVAQRHGLFAAQRLAVKVQYTRGSAPQIAGLVRGDYELIQTAPDNVLCAHFAPQLFGLSTVPNIAMVLGGSVGLLSLYAQPHIGTIAHLRGAVLGVDNPDSGFALVLRDMLARNELLVQRDYRFAIAGGTSERLDAVRSGAVAATLLYSPYDLLAEASGLRRLAVSTDLYAAYASLATAAMRDWLDAHGDAITRYITAILGALRFIYAPAHATDVQAILRDPTMLGLDAPTAARAHAAFTAPRIGFGVTAALDQAGLDQVIALRSTYGTHASTPGSAADACDLRWYARALPAES